MLGYSIVPRGTRSCARKFLLEPSVSRHQAGRIPKGGNRRTLSCRQYREIAVKSQRKFVKVKALLALGSTFSTVETKGLNEIWVVQRLVQRSSYASKSAWSISGRKVDERREK